MRHLPLLISIPHGGTDIPVEVGGRNRLSGRDIFEDGDALTSRIYDVRQRGLIVIAASIARVYVDLNRAPLDRPPANPDGVVKTRTVSGKPVYRAGDSLGDREIRTLLKNYYVPYHRALIQSLRRKPIKLALDCHSMLDQAPASSPRPGIRRPLFCLSNGGDSHGEPTDDVATVTCPPETIRRLAVCIQNAFKVAPEDVRINDPFKGGYITRHHGKGRVPWIQLEMNRRLYLISPWFDERCCQVDPERLNYLRERFILTIESFFQKDGV